MYFLGLILVWGLVAGEGKSQQIPSQGDYQALTPSQNQLTAPLANPQTQPQQQQQPEQQQPSQNAERRLSLEDFFMNRNNQQQQQQQESQQASVQQQLQQPLLPQFQVQQSDPNSVLLVRDTQFPSRNGGVLSRLLMLRRMLRLRRWARRLSIIPRLVRLGVQSTSLRQAASEPQPVIVASNRVGRSYNDEPYDPRDYVFGNKGYYSNNTPSSQENYNSQDLPKQDAYSRDADRYYDTVNDLPYDLYDNRDVKTTSNYGVDDSIVENQNKYRDAYNTDSDDARKLKEYYALNNIQQKLQNQENSNQQYSNYQNSNQNPNFSSKQKELISSLTYPQNSQQDSYQTNKQAYEGNNQQDYQATNYPQNQKAQENTDQYNRSPESNGYHGNQAQEEQHQLQLLRQQQIQLLREQQLLQLLREQQLLLEKERLQNLQQQGNLYQQQNQNQQSQIESEAAYPNYSAQTYNQDQQNSHEKTEKNGYDKPLVADTSNIGGSSTRLGSGGNVIGVGVNVGIKPPAIDIAVTKPVSPVIKPLPPITPIFQKPVAAPVAEGSLVPLGFLPRPLLNLNGRVFFGAEVGKGVKVGR